MMKSSAYRTRLTFAALAALTVGNNEASARCRPSSAKLASTGEMMPPCGVPACVENMRPDSINPDFSHFLKIALSMQTLAISQS